MFGNLTKKLSRVHGYPGAVRRRATRPAPASAIRPFPKYPGSCGLAQFRAEIESNPDLLRVAKGDRRGWFVAYFRTRRAAVDYRDDLTDRSEPIRKTDSGWALPFVPVEEMKQGASD